MPLILPSFLSGFRMFKGEDVQTLATALGNLPAGFINQNNLTAVTDPTANNDNTQGYGVGSIWINQTANGTAVYECLSAVTGAAVWSFSGAKLGDPEPNNLTTQAGGAVRLSTTPCGSFKEEGNIYRTSGFNISQNGADLTDDILFGVQLPSGIFDINGRMAVLNAVGNLAANANNKRIKVWANPTMAGQVVNADGSITGGTVTGVGAGVLLYDSLVQTGNNIGWDVVINLMKYGVNGSNTQTYQSTPIFGTAHGGISKVLPSTLAENAAINLVVTGSSPTTGAAGDVVLDQFMVNWCN